MNWETIITATVVAAIISGIFGLIKAFVDARTKRSATIMMFKYKKLIEIINNTQYRYDTIDVDYETGATAFDLSRIKTLRLSYAQAKPFFRSKESEALDLYFHALHQVEHEYIRNRQSSEETQKVEIFARLIEAQMELEYRFEAAVHKALQRLF